MHWALQGIANTCPGGLVLSAVVQCICRIPPEAEYNAEVHFSVHNCLAAPSAVCNLSGEMSRDPSTKAWVPANENCWQFKLKLHFLYSIMNSSSCGRAATCFLSRTPKIFLFALLIGQHHYLSYDSRCLVW